MALLEPEPVQEAQNSCAEEIERLCPDGGDRQVRRRCIERHSSEISPGCRPSGGRGSRGGGGGGGMRGGGGGGGGMRGGGGF